MIISKDAFYLFVIIVLLSCLAWFFFNYASLISENAARYNRYLDEHCHTNAMSMNAIEPTMNSIPNITLNVTASSQPKKNPINPVNR